MPRLVISIFSPPFNASATSKSYVDTTAANAANGAKPQKKLIITKNINISGGTSFYTYSGTLDFYAGILTLNELLNVSSLLFTLENISYTVDSNKTYQQNGQLCTFWKFGGFNDLVGTTGTISKQEYIYKRYDDREIKQTNGNSKIVRFNFDGNSSYSNMLNFGNLVAGTVALNTYCYPTSYVQAFSAVLNVYAVFDNIY